MSMMSRHDERMKKFNTAGLYLVTSQAHSHGRDTLDIVKSALAGGARLIQLREKELPVSSLFHLAEQARKITAAANALLIINDRLDVALGVEADGVHLGQTDFPVSAARRLAPDLIICASTHTIAEARAAQAAGASYVNIGPLFPTMTTHWNGNFLGIKGLKAIVGSISIPFTVMGGIKKHHIPDLLAEGVKTIAAITAITDADNQEQAAREFLTMIHAGRSK